MVNIVGIIMVNVALHAKVKLFTLNLIDIEVKIQIV